MVYVCQICNCWWFHFFCFESIQVDNDFKWVSNASSKNIFTVDVRFVEVSVAMSQGCGEGNFVPFQALQDEWKKAVGRIPPEMSNVCL